MVRPMFPHELDRFRVIQRLLRHARETLNVPEGQAPGLGQKALASRSGLLQTDISNIENLEQAAAKHNRRVSREKLVRLAVLGLELGQPRLDVLLWLYDGSPLGPQDLRTSPYLRKYLAEPIPRSYVADELRRCAADWLREVGTYYTGGEQRDRLRPPEVFFPDVSDEKDWVQVSRIRLDQERMPGHCSRISLLPHELPHPEINLADRAVDERYYGSEGLRREALQIAEERKRAFHDRLTTFGYRGIHSRPAIRRYVSDPAFSGLPLDRRRKHVQALVDLLRQYPYLEIGLVDAVPDTGLTRAVPGERRRDPAAGGHAACQPVAVSIRATLPRSVHSSSPPGPATLVDITTSTAHAQLRARHRLRTIDALQVAAALDAGATRFVTNDRALRSVDDLEVLVLADTDDVQAQAQPC